MHKVFVLYRLKENVSLDEYMLWSREVDQRITNRQRGCIRFEVYAIEGSEDGSEPGIDIVEDIEVESWEVWQETLRGEGMRPVMEDFPKYADEKSVTLVYGRRVV